MQPDSLVAVVQNVGMVVWESTIRQIYIEFILVVILSACYGAVAYRYGKQLFDYLIKDDGMGDYYAPCILAALLMGIAGILLVVFLISSTVEVLNPTYAAFSRLMGR